jgi:spore maturation protein CgeB
MLKSIFKEIFYRAKDWLRRVPPISFANRIYKANQLRAGLRSLNAGYAKHAHAKTLKYTKSEAIATFKHRVMARCPTFYPKKAGELRIFWVGTNRDQDESGFLQALRRLASVTEFHNWQGSYGQWYWDQQGRVRVYDPAIVALNDKCLLLQIEAALQDGPIDLLMGQMWANYLSKEALARVRSCGIPVINISMDDRLPDNWGTQDGTRLGAVGLASVTDLVLTTSSETCAWYGVEYCPAIFWPLASDPGVFAPSHNNVRDIDVLFIGNKYGTRERIVQDLKRRQIHVDCYGAGWPNGPSTAEQSAALFKRAKIILGVGTVGYCDDVYTLKLRDFDAPMSGALYLTHRSPDLALLYQEGTEIECYATSSEVARKIHHYLAHPKELSSVAAAGHAKAIARDSWFNRLHLTFLELGLIEGTESNILSIGQSNHFQIQ